MRPLNQPLYLDEWAAENEQREHVSPTCQALTFGALYGALIGAGVALAAVWWL